MNMNGSSYAIHTVNEDERSSRRMKINKIERLPKLPERMRVAAYARVSSGKDTMLHSLSAQIDYYTEFIGKNPDWAFAGIFVDEAVTGNKEMRPDFQRMLSECRAGKIQMIITKSISRFARNTVTILNSVRELKSLGVDVFFEDGELMLSILSSYAQEESRSVSETANGVSGAILEKAKSAECVCLVIHWIMAGW